MLEWKYALIECRQWNDAVANNDYDDNACHDGQFNEEYFDCGSRIENK